MKKLIVVFLLISSFAKGQTGYKLTITAQEAVGRTLQMSYYFCSRSKPVRIDSVKITDANQKVVFEKPKSVLGGIYSLKFSGEEKGVDVILDNGDMPVLTLNAADPTKSSVVKSPKVTAQWAIQNATAAAEKKQLAERYRKLYPNSRYTTFLTLEERRANPGQYTSEEYFSGIDVDDKAMALLPNLYQALFGYVNTRPVTYENYITLAEALLEKTRPDGQMRGIYLDWMFKNIDYFRRPDLEPAYIYLYEKFVKGKKVQFLAKDNEQQISMNAVTKNHLPLGGNIIDLKLKTTDSTDVNLSDLYKEKANTLVVFYDPSCVHCQESVPELDSLLQTPAFADKDLQKVLFLNANYNEDEWRGFITKYRLENWVNVRYFDGSTKYIEKYKTYSNPAYFLLDDKGIILAKDAFPETLSRYLNN